MSMSRRSFLASSVVGSAGFLGMSRLVEAIAEGDTPKPSTEPFGKLLPDPKKIFDLPKGFSYKVISKVGNKMADGLLVPGAPDGMAAFPGPDGLTLLVRNHELTPEAKKTGPFGAKNENLDKIDPKYVYDRHSKSPSLGGTTTLVYDTRKGKLVREYLSLAGTIRNCAGGPTPWGTWLTCEEADALEGPYRVKETVKQDDKEVEKLVTKYHCDKDHGYVFEVRPSLDVGLVEPVALKAMGRFYHEAVAVDPKSGIVYLTEDRGDGLLYRFIPNTPGKLADGGKLQALTVVGRRSLKTGNLESDKATVAVGKPMEVGWVTLDDVEAPKDDLRKRGFKAGAAQFVRGEGMWTADDGSIYFACTEGGPTGIGQIWKYEPSSVEGKPAEKKTPGRLTLFSESTSDKVLRNCDNLTVAPWGDVIVCEDRAEGTPHRLVGITPAGEYYHLAAHPSASELAGVCFSPDGSTLFVNIQNKGLTVAISGPWRG